MTTEELAYFAVAVALGSYLQAVTGFALGLVVMGAATLFSLSAVPAAAFVVSVLAFVNSVMALAGHTRRIRWRWVASYLLGVLPALAFGVWLLDRLSGSASEVLQLILGGFLIVAAALLLFRPRPKRAPSGAVWRVAAGVASGLFNGLFATGGPPIVYHMYRQPMTVAEVRATLLALFSLSTLGRIGYVGVTRPPEGEVLMTAVACLPVVVAATYLARRYPPPLSDPSARRLAFGLLVVLGSALLI